MKLKTKRDRGSVLLSFPKPLLKDMGWKNGMTLNFHMDNGKLVISPATNLRAHTKQLKNLVRKNLSTKRASPIHNKR